MLKLTTSKKYHLKDSPFFRLRSRRKLAKLLFLSPRTLSNLSKERKLYTQFWIPKKGEAKQWKKSRPLESLSKDYRQIDIPIPILKNIQTRLANLMSRIYTPHFLFTPVKGRSYIDNASYHRSSKAFWLLDVENYFPNCSDNNVARLFRRDFECSSDVTAILVHLTTINQGLPQGSPCSPILAYISNHQMWEDVNNVVGEAQCIFSLYADDITISGNIIPKEMIWKVKQIVFKHGFSINKKKEYSLINSPVEVTGVIIRNNRLYVPNRQGKKLEDLKVLYRTINDPKIKSKISGLQSQRNQVRKNCFPEP